MVAAPASGCGKTTVTLGLLRHLARLGQRVGALKVGPDYIDPSFLAAAAGRTCRNIDPWAMRPETIAAAARAAAPDGGLVICEGVMGLFDGAPGGAGATADVAALTGWPVVLVIDARAQGASAAALLRGFAGHRPDVAVAGVLFNRVGSAGHAAILGEACEAALPHIPVLGALPRDPALALPERHLGLVPAAEHGALERFLDAAADTIAAHLDVDRLTALACPWPAPTSPDKAPLSPDGAPLPPLGRRIAVARDEAFAFAYPAVLEGWQGLAEVATFSPLADEAPDGAADAVYLPGGYPELHAGRLAANGRFLDGLRGAAARGAVVYGECGGYMVLGRGLVDGSGRRHAMAGLLPLETSFAERGLHLGYRRATLAGNTSLGRAGAMFRGHQFHYARILSEGAGEPLFRCADARGRDQGPAGRRQGTVLGSFVHLIDRELDG